MRDFINQYVKREDAILNVGCGNSRLTEDMFEDGDVFFFLPLTFYSSYSANFIPMADTLRL